LKTLQETSDSLFPIEYWQVTASKNEIRTLLSQREPYILHFIGHGDVIESYGGSILVLIDDETVNWELFHSALAVPAAEVCALFDSGTPPTVVILQSCNTGRGGSVRAYSSLAAKLVKAGIPLVVAFQYEMQNRTASEFGKRLYQALAYGESLEAAVNQARRYLFDLAVDRGFGTPIIYVSKHARKPAFLTYRS
jgi:CHAT domain-containing protein